MCIIIYKPKGVTIPEQTLKTCWDKNTHGAGYAMAEDGKLIITKGFFKYVLFLGNYLEAEEKDNPMILHFRISTGGHVDTPNCHPFLVNKDLAFAHNGVISGYGSLNSNYSDTVHFNRQILKNLPDNFTDNEALMGMIADHIGSYNKLAFITSSGEVAIVNESQGDWHKGAWYSNPGYKQYAYNNVTGQGYGKRGRRQRYANSYYYCRQCGHHDATKYGALCEECKRVNSLA